MLVYMLKKTIFSFFVVSALSCHVLGAEPDWSHGYRVAEGGRANPYELSVSELSEVQRAGKLHAQIYPVEITGSLPPYRPVKRLIEDQNTDFFRKWLSHIIQDVSNIRSFNDIEKGLGLHPYPLETDHGVYSVPYPKGERPDSRMGMGLIERHGADGFTFSCAACHSSRLFGKTVLGMTNRFPKANEFFVRAKSAVAVIPADFFQVSSGATLSEKELFKETKKNIQFVGVKKPIALGLDTSLAQVALSLNLRKPGPWAEKETSNLHRPRADWLDDNPADSKPAVWWNLKYKNRWLSDGSVVSGNPIITNILWNEIGRGVDLKDLSIWLQQNSQVIKEIATAAFSSEAPLFTDFFPAEMIDLERARAGEKIFESTCSKCHGHYEKNWNHLPETAPLVEKLKTLKVRYHEKTRVIDVGTDPFRRLGMRSLEKLNDLQISKDHNVLIQAQKGYVPPPLVGIWARWPYFHNNSIPSLCALLTPGSQRPRIYWARPADDKDKDFDVECNGYPETLSSGHRNPQYKYDTRRKGMGNQGHDERILLKNGKEILSSEDKKNLIQFLQTL